MAEGGLGPRQTATAAAAADEETETRGWFFMWGQYKTGSGSHTPALAHLKNPILPELQGD